MAVRPFRFGIQLSSLPVDDWADSARRIEALGYSSLVVPDHFSASLWDPTTMLGGVAAVTRTLRVGALVYGIDYRHPVIYARQAATLQAMSGGRHEFGIGAGWMIDDYRWAGMHYDKPSVRIERLEEALTIIESMWSKKKTTFTGKHYQVNEAPLKIEMPARPKILIGGGGEKLLAVAGRHADIVGINPKIPDGRITAATALDIDPGVHSPEDRLDARGGASGWSRCRCDRTERAGVHVGDHGRPCTGSRDGRRQHRNERRPGG